MCVPEDLEFGVDSAVYSNYLIPQYYDSYGGQSSLGNDRVEGY